MTGDNFPQHRVSERIRPLRNVSFSDRHKLLLHPNVVLDALVALLNGEWFRPYTGVSANVWCAIENTVSGHDSILAPFVRLQVETIESFGWHGVCSTLYTVLVDYDCITHKCKMHRSMIDAHTDTNNVLCNVSKLTLNSFVCISHSTDEHRTLLRILNTKRVIVVHLHVYLYECIYNGIPTHILLMHARENQYYERQWSNESVIKFIARERESLGKRAEKEQQSHTHTPHGWERTTMRDHMRTLYMHCRIVTVR